MSSTTIGKRIALIRMHRGMTQAELAAAIGVSRNVIYNIEHGLTKVDLDLAAKIAAALHCRIADLRAPLDAPLLRGRTSRRREILPSWLEVLANVRAN